MAGRSYVTRYASFFYERLAYVSIESYISSFQTSHSNSIRNPRIHSLLQLHAPLPCLGTATLLPDPYARQRPYARTMRARGR
jgi:hypothetical protein